MENAVDIIQQQAEDALKRLGVSNRIASEHVAQSILHQNVYWEKPLTNGDKLMFVRFFSPVIQRSEVFLGNVLLNAFLSKTFANAVKEARLGNVELVANDLENYYFLIRTISDIAQLVGVFRAKVESDIPSLFLSEPSDDRGIYGSLETMLEFEKANVEPFPLFVMPQCYVAQLEATVRQSLQCKVEHSNFRRNPTSIMANLAFFYSHDGSEMQSPYLFLARLARNYNIVSTDQLLQALLLDQNADLDDESKLKKAIEDTLKQKSGRTFSPDDLQELLKQIIDRLGRQVEQDPDNWLMPYVREKFLNEDEKKLTAALLGRVSIGYSNVSILSKATNVGCRVCGTGPVVLEDKSILMGQNIHKFHNQSSKYGAVDDPKICLRCAICAYLMVKLMGSEAVGQPQIPKTYNLIFHYGKHDSSEVERLTHCIDLLWNSIQRHQNKERIQQELKTLKDNLEKARGTKRERDMEIEYSQKEEELQKAQGEIREELETVDLDEYPWMRDFGALQDLSENPSLDIFSNILSESKVERHILGLGMGGYRIILFVLPQVRPPRDKEHDFAQRRFSNSRIAITTLLSFLRKLCECDGPFYYQSLPTLTPDAFQPDTFYIDDELVHVEQAQKEYEAITQLAWRLVKQRGSDGFVRKVILAEKLLEDPLGTFSVVMRDSPILGQEEGSYKRLKTTYRQDWKTYDLTEYAKFIQELSAFQEVSPMALKVDKEVLDEFFPKLFRILDTLGLLPLPLSDKPNKFEKYPRLLFGSIRRYNDVEAGFREWESRVLRDSPYLKEEYYPDIERLRQWMVEHKDILTEKASMQHLNTSLYARVFSYLYPRRVLANAYCAKEQGNLNALDEEALRERFPYVIETDVQEVKETYQNEWESIVADARANLLAKRAYYERIISEKPKASGLGVEEGLQ